MIETDGIWIQIDVEVLDSCCESSLLSILGDLNR